MHCCFDEHGGAPSFSLKHLPACRSFRSFAVQACDCKFNGRRVQNRAGSTLTAVRHASAYFAVSYRTSFVVLALLALQALREATPDSALVFSEGREPLDAHGCTVDLLVSSGNLQLSRGQRMLSLWDAVRLLGRRHVQVLVHHLRRTPLCSGRENFSAAGHAFQSGSGRESLVELNLGKAPLKQVGPGAKLSRHVRALQAVSGSFGRAFSMVIRGLNLAPHQV